MEVTVLRKPAELFNALSARHAELLLIDMGRTDCSAIELTKMIRQDSLYIDIPIVCFGAPGSESQHAAALAAGADDFFGVSVSVAHLALALRCRAERYRSLRALIMRDSLTGLYNHAAIKDYLMREMSLIERHAAPLAVAMIDLDFFKNVNDTYGHPAGDQVICALARLLQQNLRRGDIVGRYGGEEFVVIMPATTLEAAVAVLTNIGAAFAQIRHHVDGAVFSVTCSAGVAAALGHTDADAMLRGADAALYEAKRTGRNRVVASTAS